MAEVPLPTRHLPHTHVRAEGQVGGIVGRIYFLLTGSGLHIAGVPSRAAVLAVLTAHSLGGQSSIMLLSPSPPKTQFSSPGTDRWALTWGSWQQAQPVLRLGQQVCPTGQLVCWSQPVSLRRDWEARWAGFFSSPGTTLFPF